MIYLCSPYTVKQIIPQTAIAAIKEGRYRAALKCLAHFTNEGFVLFSPIVHSHPMSLHYTLPGDWDFWQKVDREFISLSSELWILTIDGWRESTGVNAEIEIAREFGLPISTVSPEDYAIKKL